MSHHQYSDDDQFVTDENYESEDNLLYQWLEHYTTEHYLQEASNKKTIVNELCDDLTEKQKEKLVEIVATSCNYEIWQWTDAYWNNTTWPLDEIFPKRKG